MDKIYTKEELKIKKLTELKEILKSRGLTQTGKKEELIDKILNDQPILIKEKPKFDGTFLDILPQDIRGMVGKYRVENEPNNKVSIELINEASEYFRSLEEQETMNKLLERIGIPFKIMINKKKEELIKQANKEGKNLGGFHVHQYFTENGIYDLPDREIILIENIIITDEMLTELIMLLLSRAKINYEFINKVLIDNNINSIVTRINIGPKSGKKKDSYRYFIGRFKLDKSIDV